MNARLAWMVFAGAAAVLVGHNAGAQALDRSKQPIASPASAFKFPAVTSRQLDNGLRVIVVEEHALPLVAVRAVLGVDSLLDPAGKEGLHALTMAMLREGTSTMTTEQQSAAIGALGNDVSPLRFTTISQNLDPSLALMADMLLQPAFPPAAFDRQKAVVAEVHSRRRLSQAAIGVREFYTHLLGAQDPMARSIIAPDASISSIGLEDVKAFYAANIRPNNAAIIVVGDVRAEEVVARVRQYFGAWKRGALSPRGATVSASPTATTIYLFDRPGAPQSFVYVGGLGPSRSSGDFAALETLAPVLGASANSRLQRSLRDQHAYMYSGTPFAVRWGAESTRSILYGSAAIGATKTDSALIEWMHGLRGIRDSSATQQEIEMAQLRLVGLLSAETETADSTADRLVYLVQNGLPLTYYDAYAARIEKVTREAVAGATRRNIDPDHLVIVVVGDRKVVEPALRAANIAPVVIVER